MQHSRKLVFKAYYFNQLKLNSVRIRTEDTRDIIFIPAIVFFFDFTKFHVSFEN